MRAFAWVRQRGNVWGLKQHSSPGYRIQHWIKRDGEGYWQIDGAKDGIVWGKFKTLRTAKSETLKRLGLAGCVCSHCGSPMATG